jgi:hypothetical protein
MRVIGIGPFHAADVWYTPFVWWPGLLLGFLVNRGRLHRAACFVWFPGLLWLLYGILSKATVGPEGMSWMTRVRNELFPLKQADCSMSECLGLLVTTWPALNSITYSIGAAFALLTNREKTKSEDLPTDLTTLEPR